MIDDAIERLKPLFMFGMPVYVIVYIFRRAVESVAPIVTTKKWWRDFVLVSLPPLLGALLVLLPTGFDFPAELKTTTSRIMYFGVPIGFFSGFLYRNGKYALEKKTGLTLNDDPVSPVVQGAAPAALAAPMAPAAPVVHAAAPETTGAPAFDAAALPEDGAADPKKDQT
jgi:hypothetical protein